MIKKNLSIDEGLAQVQDAELDVGDPESGRRSRCLGRGCGTVGGHDE
jgi:hypothetical protein